MAIFKPEYLERELKRWARPDAHRFVKSDWRRFVKPKSDAAMVFGLYERKFRPDQARVPPGSREGGQWTDEGGGGGSTSSGGGEVRPGSGTNDPRVLSDAIPDNYYKPGAQVAARISRARAAECEFMRRQDEFICKAFKSEACYTQAYLRYSNCLSGRQVPPLNF